MKKRTKKNEMTPVSKVVAYMRVSTEQQADQGNSLDAQRARLVSYAAAMELEIVAFEVDAGLSASTLERPGLQAALGALESGEADGLLVVKLDRLTRSVRDLLVLVDEYFHDSSLLSVSESIDTRSAAGRMLLKILTTIGEWEREAIGERTSAVLQHMKAEGMFTGGFPPYGYRLVDGSLVEDWNEQCNVGVARNMRAGGSTLRAIAARLGTNPRTGKPFAASQIARMM